MHNDRWTNMVAGASGADRRAILDALPGVRWEDAFRGTVAVGRRQAQITLEPGDWLRAYLPDERAEENEEDGEKCLRRQAALPGNVRYAIGSESRGWLADTEVDGCEHLPHSVQEIVDGFLAACGQGDEETSGGNGPPMTREALRAQLESLDWNGQEVVDRADGQFEVRAAIGGNGVPVRVEARSNCVRLYRVILSPTAMAAGGNATARHAMRVATKLRFCRLAVDDGGLVLESRLHARLPLADWLPTAAVAVASCSRQLQEGYRMLSQDGRIAGWYERLFGRGY